MKEPLAVKDLQENVNVCLESYKQIPPASVSRVVFCIRNKMGFFVVVKNKANLMYKVVATYSYTLKN